MPLIKLETNHPFSPPESAALCAKLSRLAAEVIGKPEQYVQAIVASQPAMMRHGGADGPAAFVEVRSIGGLSPKVNTALADRVCRLLKEVGIPGERVYLNFVDVPATHWGHDGSTFG